MKKRIPLPPEARKIASHITFITPVLARSVKGNVGRAVRWNCADLQLELDHVAAMAKCARSLGKYLSLLHGEMKAAAAGRPERGTPKPLRLLLRDVTTRALNRKPTAASRRRR